MEIGKKEILEIFRQNFNSNIVSTPLGEGFELDPYEAFIFSSITGSGYFNNPVMPFSPKGLLKLFYNACNYNFVTGVFDNTNLNYTPYQLSVLHPYIFEGARKIVVPIEFTSEKDLQVLLDAQYHTLHSVTEYLILRVEISKKGNGLEPFMEYIAYRYFSQLGFICENQIPLSHSLGSPDFGGYGLPDLHNHLKSFGIFQKGYSILELSMLRFRDMQKNFNPEHRPDLLVVGEAKTSTIQMRNQLDKYLSSNMFDQGIEIHPTKLLPSSRDSGLLRFDKFWNIFYLSPANNWAGVDKKKQKVYKEWLVNYCKFYLLANMSNIEFQDFYSSIYGKLPSSNSEIVQFVTDLSSKNILQRLQYLKII